MNTHFAYEWTPGAYDTPSPWQWATCPKMHVWVGLLDTQEIVDFTTRHLALAAARQGMAWTAARPPSYSLVSRQWAAGLGRLSAKCRRFDLRLHAAEAALSSGLLAEGPPMNLTTVIGPLSHARVNCLPTVGGNCGKPCCCK